MIVPALARQLSVPVAEAALSISKSWVWFSRSVVILFVIVGLNTGVTVNTSVSCSAPPTDRATVTSVLLLTLGGV